VEAGNVTAVHAAWVVPAATAPPRTGYSATWVGIGGVSEETLIQAGTEGDIEDGVPSYYAWVEGLPGGTLGIPTHAPHPNAAKVFVNWLLSREGQIALQKLGRPDAHNSRRIDIPKDDVDPYNRLEEGKKYFDLARPEYQDLTQIFKLVKEVLPQK